MVDLTALIANVLQPVNGGAQAYLACTFVVALTFAFDSLNSYFGHTDAYGPLISYLYSWTALSLLKPGSAAIIALIFG